MNKPSIYSLTKDQLMQWLESRGYRQFQAEQVWEGLYRKRITRLLDMTDVSPACVGLLDEHYTVQTLTTHLCQQSADGTVKFLFRLEDGHLIETVLMRHKYGLSVCLTTQVGCNIGCSFCASGALAKERDLTAGEMVEQILKVQQYLDRTTEMEEAHQDQQAHQNQHTHQDQHTHQNQHTHQDEQAHLIVQTQCHEQPQRVSHVVVMGIGEPLDNFVNLIDFLSIIQDHKGLAFGPRHITVSTSGLADKIVAFADSGLRVNLALSLHAASDRLRTELMRINRVHSLERIIEAVDYYLGRTNRRITLEYILLQDVNDQPQHARQLVKLISHMGRRAAVNLIPYNPVEGHPHPYRRSSREAAKGFYDVLKQAGVNCSIRLEQGADIDAACGQLRSKHQAQVADVHDN